MAKDVDREEPVAKRSRRDLLAGAAGALAVVAAESVAKMPAADATQGSAIIAGQYNGETSPTFLENTSSGNGLNVQSADAFGLSAGGGTGHAGVAAGGGSNAEGVLAEGGGTGSGVIATGGSSSGKGVEATGGAPHGSGLVATGVGNGTGVWGYGGGNGSTGIIGVGGASNGIGVIGDGAGTGSGVLGQGASGGSGPGVTGNGGTPGGHGVIGNGAGGGFGVWGKNDTGLGVVGTSSGGVGVHAESALGTALEVQGRAFFRQGGTATVKATKSSVKVLLDETQFLGSSSYVLATLQQNRAGVWVSSAVPNVANHNFVINLNQAVAQNTKVGWLIVN